MKNLIFLGFTLLFCSSASIHKVPQVEVKPMPYEAFLQSPFGHEESIADFTQSMPKGTRIQKLIKRNPRPNHRPDTIYSFIYKKSKISVYKTQFNQEYILGGSIKNPQIELINGIRIGMTKEEFYHSFTNLELANGDSILVQKPGAERRFNFYFNRKGKLDRYTFSGKRK